MTTYHVKTTGDDGTGDGSEGNPWRSIDYALTQCAAGSTSFGSSADEVLVWYDASGTYAGAWTPVITRGTVVVGVDSQGVRWDTRAHWSTGTDDSAGLFSRQERPTVTASSGTVVPFYEWTRWVGLKVDASGGSANGFAASSSNREVEIRDCEIIGGSGTGITGTETGSLVLRCIVRGWTGALAITDSAQPGVTFAGCLAYDNAGRATITGTGSLAENCTAYNNATGFSATGFWEVNAGTAVNCIAEDNGSDYGFRTLGTVTTCNAYTSDAGTYHTLGNYEGGTPAGCTEVASQFVDAAADDYRLAAASPLIGAGTAVATAELDVDLRGLPWLSPPSVGAYETEPPVDIIVRGSHRIVVTHALAWGDEAAREDRWSISGTPAALVSEATLLDAYTVQLDLDRALRAGTTYTLTTTATVSGGSTPDGSTFVGKRIEAGTNLDARGVLYGIDAPIARGGFRGGDYAVGSTGGRRYVGGAEQIKALIADAILTRRGVRPWAPEHGSTLQPKRSFPLDLRAEAEILRALVRRVPYVVDAEVTLRRSQSAHEMIITVRATYDEGELTMEVTA